MKRGLILVAVLAALGCQDEKERVAYLAVDANVVRIRIVDHARDIKTFSGEARELVPSPDGKRFAIAVLHEGKSGVFIVDRDGKTVDSRDLMKDPTSDVLPLDIQPTWSSDGTKLAFVRLSGGTTRLVAVDRDGKNPTVLHDEATDGGHVSDPAWKGTSIALTLDYHEGPQLHVLDVVTKSKKAVSTGKSDFAPAWSPTEDRIAFVRREGGESIYTVKSDGSAERRVTDWSATETVPVTDSEPRWSPKGKIAFTSKRASGTDIYVMDADGKNAKKITDHNAIDRSARWSRDGKKLLFVSSRGGGTKGEGIFVVAVEGGSTSTVKDEDGAEISPVWIVD